VTGSAFSFQLTATGFPAPKITESESLPEGVAFKSATATFSGTPEAGTSASYSVIVTARNATGTITQNSPSPSPNPSGVSLAGECCLLGRGGMPGWVERRHAGLMTQRSQVQILPPLPS
jgi:hypothetical protein